MLVDYHRQYRDTGVILVPQIIDRQRTPLLRTISEHCLCQWRLFPNPDGSDPLNTYWATVMRHLNDPGYFNHRRQWLVEVLNLCADPAILGVVEEVLGEKPLFRCTSLFMNPLMGENDGNWHRDTQFGHPDLEKEKVVVLEEAQKTLSTGRSPSIQLQIALAPSDDSCYVPGSHLRWDTDDELFIRLGQDKKFACSNLMPNAVRFHQEPGDAAAFHPNGHHRGRYHCDKLRRTFMLTYTARSVVAKDEFSYQPWCAQPGYLDGVQPHTRAFFEDFIETYGEFWKTPHVSVR